MMAYFTACQMSVHTKHPVKPSDLLKPLQQKKAVRDRKADAEYIKERFKGLLK